MSQNMKANTWSSFGPGHCKQLHAGFHEVPSNAATDSFTAEESQCVQKDRSLDVQQHSMHVPDTEGTCEKMMGALCAMRWK